MRRVNGTVEVYLMLGFMSFVVALVPFGVAPEPYIQDTILN